MRWHADAEAGLERARRSAVEGVCLILICQHWAMLADESNVRPLGPNDCQFCEVIA